MTVEIPTGFALAAWEFSMPGDVEPWYCTMGVDLPSGGGPPSGAADDLFIAWRDNILGLQSTTMTLNQCIVKVGSDGPPIMGYSTLGTAPGQTSGSFLPQNCAMLVDKLSAAGGRRNRGRMYIPAALPEANVDNVGTITSGLVTGANAAFGQFLSALQDGVLPANIAYPPVILHSPGISTLPLPTPITSFRVQSVISTQRKRLR